MKLILLLVAVCACYATSYAQYAGLSSIAEAVAAAARKRFSENSTRLRKDPITEPLLLIAEPFGISRLNLTAQSRRLMLRIDNIGGIDYHLGRDRIYWSDLSTGRIYSRTLSARGSASYKVELLIDRSPLEWRPRALAIDYVNEKLYVVDSRGKKVHVFNLDGKDHSVIFDGFLHEPMDIAIDPQEGVMFIADGMRIIRVNMDGTEPKAIVGHPRYYIKSATLDLENKRIYWSDNTYHRIKSANYDGSGLTVVLKNEHGKAFSLLGPANLAFNQGLLYFYDDMWRRIASVKIDTLGDGHAIESSYKVVYDVVTVKAMRIVLPADQHKVVKNPCAANNGLAECEKLCLISAKKQADGPLTHKCL